MRNPTSVYMIYFPLNRIKLRRYRRRSRRGSADGLTARFILEDILPLTLPIDSWKTLATERGLLTFLKAGDDIYCCILGPRSQRRLSSLPEMDEVFHVVGRRIPIHRNRYEGEIRLTRYDELHVTVYAQDSVFYVWVQDPVDSDDSEVHPHGEPLSNPPAAFKF